MGSIYKASLVVFLLMFYRVSMKAAATFHIHIDQPVIEMINQRLFTEDSSEQVIGIDSIAPVVKFKRGKAILFTIFTGFLGGHRIYLGTHQRTPILYSVTLGGLGILPVIDLIHLVFTKDLTVFENKTQIIMWSK
ncbi:MAG: TM2 domain-containing protein [Vicingus serpentipes]|nr:TM2 domain-containing protein [Vicingus serpentipes]